MLLCDVSLFFSSNYWYGQSPNHEFLVYLYFTNVFGFPFCLFHVIRVSTLYSLICSNLNDTCYMFLFIVYQPPKIRSFINGVVAAPFESIEEPLKSFFWDFDKVPLQSSDLSYKCCLYLGWWRWLLLIQGDFHHWVDLFNHFDTFFEKYIKPRKDLHVEDDFLEPDPPFPKEAVLQILRVVRIILDNCTNKHFYSSYEVNFSLWLIVLILICSVPKNLD